MFFFDGGLAAMAVGYFFKFFKFFLKKFFFSFFFFLLLTLEDGEKEKEWRIFIRRAGGKGEDGFEDVYNDLM